MPYDAASDAAPMFADQPPDPRPGRYYVSVIDGPRRALLAGPWTTHIEALCMVDTVRTLACELDPRGHWYAFGTARMPDDGTTPVLGVLNRELRHRQIVGLPIK